MAEKGIHHQPTMRLAEIAKDCIALEGQDAALVKEGIDAIAWIVSDVIVHMHRSANALERVAEAQEAVLKLQIEVNEYYRYMNRDHHRVTHTGPETDQ